MATKLWAPNAAAISEVHTITVGGTIANGQVYTVTINSKTVSYTASVGADTNTTVATSLTALLQASSYPEFLEVTWANPSAGVITATSVTAGVPFTNTSSATGTGTLVTATTTANSGPSDASLAGNYSPSGLPVNGDDLFFTNSAVGILYNLNALSGVTLNSLTWDTTFTGQAGLPTYNPSGYTEYRPTYFSVSSTTETFSAGTGGGSQRIQRNQGSAAWAVSVAATGSGPTGRPALLLKGTNAANTLEIVKGSVGVAIDPGETSNFSGGVNIGYTNSPKTDVTLSLGSGVTLGPVTMNGGQVTIRSNTTTLTQRDGTLNILGTAAVTTLDVEGGTCYYQSSGTIGTLTIGVDGTVDFSKDPSSRTVTNATVYGDLEDPNHTVTHTNPPNFPNGIGQGGATLNWGRSFHLARS